MDLISLLEHVPPLLHACAHQHPSGGLMFSKYDMPHVRNLRLVSKEASRIAPLALRGYTLTLRGDAWRKDTHDKAVTVLKLTKLGSLEVDLSLSGKEIAV